MKAFTGLSTSFFIDKNHNLYACGNNIKNQLSYAQASSQYLPVKTIEKVSAIASGEYHTLILKTDGTVWSTGSNGSGQLGTGIGLSDRNTFEQVKF